KRLKLTGSGSPVLENVNSFPFRGYADLDFSASGTAVYIPAVGNPRRSLQWLDSSGTLSTMNAEAGVFNNLRLSPDGTMIALLVFDRGTNNVGIFELATGRMTPITFLKGGVEGMWWASDSKHLVFKTTGQDLSGPGAYWIRADGAGEPQRIF